MNNSDWKLIKKYLDIIISLLQWISQQIAVGTAKIGTWFKK